MAASLEHPFYSGYIDLDKPMGGPAVPSDDEEKPNPLAEFLESGEGSGRGLYEALVNEDTLIGDPDLKVPFLKLPQLVRHEAWLRAVASHTAETTVLRKRAAAQLRRTTRLLQ